MPLRGLHGRGVDGGVDQDHPSLFRFTPLSSREEGKEFQVQYVFNVLGLKKPVVRFGFWF
jgi:hypothetical protein